MGVEDGVTGDTAAESGGSKRCSRPDCDQPQPVPLSGFYVKDKKKGTLFPWCKECHKKRGKRYYQANLDACRSKRREYNKRNLPARTKYMRQWREANRERARAGYRKFAERLRQRCQEDPALAERVRERRRVMAERYRRKYAELIRKRSVEYRAQHREILRQRQREWRQANPEAYLEIHRRWRRANKAIVNATTHRRRARLRGCAEHHTAAEWEALKLACEYTCLSCGRREPEVELTRDHVVPLSEGGGNDITNLAPLCKSCNSLKHTAHDDFRDEDIVAFLVELQAGGGLQQAALVPAEPAVAGELVLDSDGLPPVRARRCDWLALEPDQLEAYAAKVFRHYRAAGYPYHAVDDEAIRDQLAGLAAYRQNAGVQRKRGHDHRLVGGGNHCLALCWSFFRHAEAVPVRDRGGKMRRTPVANWADDQRLMAAVWHRLNYGTYMSDGGMRKSASILTGTQRVSNFRPAAAMTLYGNFADLLGRKGLRVWDMSAGYGGRLVGAWASAAVASYTGTDPCAATCAGLLALADAVRRADFLAGMEVAIRQAGSEDFEPEPGSLDVCFTSPPYFDHERYADEPSQSFKRFPTYQTWLTGFWKATLGNCATGLVEDGVLAVNVADTSSAPTLVEDTLRLAAECGFRLVERLDLVLSSMAGGHKYEPVLVFKKS